MGAKRARKEKCSEGEGNEEGEIKKRMGRNEVRRERLNVGAK